MRIRLGLIIATVIATLLSPLPPSALAFGGFASAPTSVAQSAIAGGIRVTWSAPADVDTGVTGYRVEYSTSGTSGTWTLATTTNSSTYTYDILGLSQIATYIRVGATTAAGIGTYGYPWTKLYGTNSMNRDANGYVTYQSGYGLGGSDPYTTLNSASFTRIRYRMDATISGTAYFAETDSYKWPNGVSTDSRAGYDASVTSLMIPSQNSPYQYQIQANVSDLNVYSNNGNVTKGSGLSGRLEIWPWNYATTTNGLSPAGDGNSYDYDDLWQIGGNYGSFQIHDMSNLKPVFVWNNSNTGANPEVAFGKNTGTHPDWTFCSGGGVAGSCPTPSAFTLQIFINIPVTPLADATPPTVARGDSKTIIKNSDTLSVRSTEVGTVYLIRNTVSVTNLASITAAAANVKNSISISTINTNTTLTLGGLLDGTYNLYAVDSANNVSTGLLATVQVDTTPPVATAFSVSSSGNSILMTFGESATLAAFDANAYSVSDSGSALSVTSASVNGLVITLNLSRSIPQGATVTFAYSTSGIATAARWSDAAGNQLTNVTSRTITNNSSIPISVILTVSDPLSKGSSTTMTALVTVVGKVTFTIAGKRIPNCLNKAASGNTPISVTCTFKPALTARQTISAVLVPTLGAYPTTVASVDRFILKRTTTR